MATERYAALYCRISRNRDGTVEGTDRQERWGRDYAARTWPGVPVRVFADDNLSATAARPEFDDLRQSVDRGEVAHLWCVEHSRLARDERLWFELAYELDVAGITELHTDREGIVRVQDEIAGLRAVLSAGERRKLIRRVNETLADLADEGRPPGGTAFGYRHARDAEGKAILEVVPRQADAARWAAEAVLKGWSLSSIARELTDRGIPTARGGKWHTSTVRKMLTSPIIAGRRVYRGEDLRRGTWEPILDENTWEAVRSILDGRREVRRRGGDTQRVGARRPSPGRRYLLTGGIAVCGVCGKQLAASQRRNARGYGKSYYTCHKVYDGKGCVGILADWLEDHVRDELIAWLRRKQQFQAAMAKDQYEQQRRELADALEDVKRRKIKLSTRWSRGDLDDDEWDAARADLETQRTELAAQLADVPPPSTVDIDPDTLLADWGEMELGERRLVVGNHIVSVTIHPASHRDGKFDPDRVKIRFE